VPAQRRLAFKSASRAHGPDADCLIKAAGGQLGAVVVPGDGHDPVRVPDRARGIRLLQITIFIKGAGTIRVVFAANLLKKLILQTHSLLSLPSIKAFAGTCARSAANRVVLVFEHQKFESFCSGQRRSWSRPGKTPRQRHLGRRSIRTHV
jgi:hypothetical protein